MVVELEITEPEYHANVLFQFRGLSAVHVYSDKIFNMMDQKMVVARMETLGSLLLIY